MAKFENQIFEVMSRIPEHRDEGLEEFNAYAGPIFARIRRDGDSDDREMMAEVYEMILQQFPPQAEPKPKPRLVGR